MRNLHFISLLFLTTFAVGGCIDSKDKLQTEGEVSFAPFLKNGTKSGTTAPLGVWAVNSADGGSLLMDDEKVFYDGDAWTTASAYLWPYSYDVSFYAYSPYDVSAQFSETGGISFVDYSVLGGENLLYSLPLDNWSPASNYGKVNLAMANALCKVEFFLKPDIHSDAHLTVTRATLSDLFTSGTFHSRPSAAWSGLADRRDYALAAEEITATTGVTADLAQFNVIPQLVKAKLVISYDYYSTDTAKPQSFTLKTDCNLNLTIGTTRRFTLTIDSIGALTVDDKQYYYDE